MITSVSYPPYPERHRGPVIVAGNAFCLKDDLSRATRLFPKAPVIAVNGASSQVRCFALFSHHASKMPKWISAAKKLGSTFTVHSSGGGRKLLDAQAAYPWVDYWWPSAKSGGTSTWCARKMAKLMGFELVILCGMPLEKGTYSDGKMARDFMRSAVIKHYREQILKEIEWHDGVKSMSGWTREVFGAP